MTGPSSTPRPPELEPVTCADLLTPCTHEGPHVPVGLDGQPVAPRRTWALYGFVIPDGRRLAGCWMQVLAGPIDGDAAPTSIAGPAGPPLLGAWDHRPTDTEQRAVLPPEGLDADDGLVLDDQCPITGRACDRPCGGACLRGQETR